MLYMTYNSCNYLPPPPPPRLTCSAQVTPAIPPPTTTKCPLTAAAAILPGLRMRSCVDDVTRLPLADSLLFVSGCPGNRL